MTSAGGSSSTVQGISGQQDAINAYRVLPPIPTTAYTTGAIVTTVNVNSQVATMPNVRMSDALHVATPIPQNAHVASLVPLGMCNLLRYHLLCVAYSGSLSFKKSTLTYLDCVVPISPPE